MHLDQVNFFHFVGAIYPVTDVVLDKHVSSYTSLFQTSKAFVMFKVFDENVVKNIQSGSIRILSDRCALGIMFDWKMEMGSIQTIAPVNAHSESLPIFPEHDVILDFEVHFVDAVSGRLLRVIQASPQDVHFTRGFVEVYEQVRELSFKNETFASVYNSSIGNIRPSQYKSMEVLSSPLSFGKTAPEGDEPLETGVLSYIDKLDMSEEAIARAMEY